MDNTTLVAVAIIVVLVLVLGYALLTKDRDVRTTRVGFYIERERFTEPSGETWTVDPLPPQAQLPTSVVKPDEAETKVNWPTA